MYSKKDKNRAIELYYQYEHSWRAVVRKLGYPSLGALKRWIKEYEKDPKAALAVGPKSRQPKYSREQQKQLLITTLTTANSSEDGQGTRLSWQRSA